MPDSSVHRTWQRIRSIGKFRNGVPLTGEFSGAGVFDLNDGLSGLVIRQIGFKVVMLAVIESLMDADELLPLAPDPAA